MLTGMVRIAPVVSLPPLLFPSTPKMASDTFEDFIRLSAPANDGGRPKYQQLRDHIVQQIDRGQLSPGALLPSEHRLAEELKIARSTVRQAMSHLEREGFIHRVHGKGTFVRDRPRPQKRESRDLFALIVPETQSGYYPAFQRSFEDAASELHCQVIVCNSNNDVDRQGNTILQLIDRRVAGVAIVPTTNPPTPAYHLRQLQQHKIPVVCCSRPVDGVIAPLLAIPFEAVGHKAGEMLIAAGHRKIAYVATTRAISSVGYERGLRAALKTATSGNAELLVHFGGSSNHPDVAQHEEEITQAIESMLARPQRPTAIFTSFDSVAELAHMYLVSHGMRVPQDISLVSFGGSWRRGPFSRQLSAVTIDEAHLGREAIDLLEKMRSGVLPIEWNHQQDVPLAWNPGRTLGAPRPRSSNAEKMQISQTT